MTIHDDVDGRQDRIPLSVEVSRTPARSAGGATVALGMAMGAAVSWSIHHSLLWAWFHGMCGWFYILPYALGWTDQWEPPQ